MIRRRPHSEVARHAQEGKTASLRSINLPQTGRGELQEISIRISKIDAVSAARPFGAPLDPYFVPAQPRLPLRQVFSCYCEGDVQWAVTIVRRNRAARQASGFERRAALEQKQHALPPDRKGLQAIVTK